VIIVLSVCNVGILWPKSWMDQNATRYGGRPRHRRHYVRWGPSSPTERGTAAPTFRLYLLWPIFRPSQQLLSSCFKLGSAAYFRRGGGRIFENFPTGPGLHPLVAKSCYLDQRCFVQTIRISGPKICPSRGDCPQRPHYPPNAA